MKGDSSDFEKIKKIVNLCYPGKITITEKTYEEYSKIYNAQLRVYFSILPVVTYIVYLIPFTVKFVKNWQNLLTANRIEYLNLNVTGLITKLIAKVNVLSGLSNKKHYNEYYYNFNDDYLACNSPIKYKSTVDDIGKRIREQFEHYKGIYNELTSKGKQELVIRYYSPEQFIKIPEKIHAVLVLVKDEHAVSLTSLKKSGFGFETEYTVKFKNTYDTLYGESGNEQKTYDVIKFNNFFRIYGIMLENKKSSKEKKDQAIKTINNLAHTGTEFVKYELKNYWNKNWNKNKKDFY